jgi:hypothetical protein
MADPATEVWPLWDRLGSIDLSTAPVDRGKAEAALFQHLAAVGAETDSFAWVDDIEQGFERLHDQVVRRPGRIWEPSSSGSWGRVTIWHPDRVMWTSCNFVHRRDLVGEPIVRAARGTLGRRWRVYRTSRTHRRWRHSYASIPDPVSVHRLAVNAADEDAIVRAGRPDPNAFPEREDDGSEWYRQVRAEARYRDAIRTYESARSRLPVLAPLLGAFCAGLFTFWIWESRGMRHRYCLCVPRPTLHLSGERLHREDGPAVTWPTGVSYWFIEGIQIPRRVVENDGRTQMTALVWTSNVERRRLLLQRLGYERFLESANARLKSQDDFGKLWRTDLEVDGERLVAVEVVNSTPDREGTHRRYYLRVPPTIRTARQAIAWTFGFENVEDYLLAAET